MQIIVDKLLFLKILDEWHQDNLHEIHPLTKFFDIVGLRYIKLQKQNLWQENHPTWVVQGILLQ